MNLQERIEHFYDEQTPDRIAALQAFNELKFFLNNGEIRAATPVSTPGHPTGWVVNHWVKKGILLGFRLGEITEMHLHERWHFYDKITFPLKEFSRANQVRIVPGGTSVRDGAHIGKHVVIMPPAYVNTGAFVDEGTMIDSHALVGSCAQIGRRVHLSAASQVGGVLEPVGAYPVIIEDDVFIGGNCGIYEGALVKQRAVIASGVTLTGSTPVYDLTRGEIYRRTPDIPLVIPEGAVVVPGSRSVDSPFAREKGISLYAPVIVKYRDANTDAATALEQSLR